MANAAKPERESALLQDAVSLFLFLACVVCIALRHAFMLSARACRFCSSSSVRLALPAFGGIIVIPPSPFAEPFRLERFDWGLAIETRFAFLAAFRKFQEFGRDPPGQTKTESEQEARGAAT